MVTTAYQRPARLYADDRIVILTKEKAHPAWGRAFGSFATG
jgi:hypothetical protein